MTSESADDPRAPARSGPPAGGRVLVVDDDAEFCEAVSTILNSAGYTVEALTDPAAAAARLSAFVPDAVVTDVGMPGIDGFSLLEIVHGFDPALSVIFVTGAATVPDAVRAIQQGAAQYLTKPLRSQELLGAVGRAVDGRRARMRLGLERRRLAAAGGARGIVAESPVMRELLERVEAVAPTRSTVLLAGETGSGKDRIAAALHAASNRAAAPLVRVNCAALSDAMLGAELFGCEKGVLPGATTRRDGRIRQADGGTLLLDEVGAMSTSVQAGLLRFLRERRFERIGGSNQLFADVRVVATTSRALEPMVAQGAFLPDLFYRLNVVTLTVPPLRTRRADLPLLVEYAIARLSSEMGVSPPEIAPDGLRVLLHHSWPGNVRELENVLENALVTARGAPLTAAVLSPLLQRRGPPGAGEPRVPGATFAEVERHTILTTYEACGRSVQRAADVLGISPRTIHYRLREYRGLAGRRQASIPPTPPQGPPPGEALPVRESRRPEG